MLRFPHFFGNLLTVGGEVAGLACRSSLTAQDDSWHSFLLRGLVDPAIMRLEGVCQLKNPMTSEIEPVTYQLIAFGLNELCYRVHLL
jgi:hypothetical protein